MLQSDNGKPKGTVDSRPSTRLVVTGYLGDQAVAS